MGLLSSTITVFVLLPMRNLIFLSCVFVLTRGYMIGNNPFHRAEYLDTQGMYYLEWQVDQLKNLITFNITAGTTGYMLFGLANNKSAPADLIVGGVLSNGQSYFSDRYTVGNALPEEDITSTTDYKLHSAKENKTHTTLSFSRSFDTCDPFDYPITENKVTVIWGYGVTDNYEVVRSYGVEGASDLYLLDPEYSPRISRDRRFSGAPTVVTRDNLQVWTIHKQIAIPDNQTSYICSIHKAPQLQRKHHMVGFDVYFYSQASRRRAHHLLVRKCNAPGRGDPRPLFEPYEGGQEQSCYQQVATTDGSMPIHFCSELWMVWAVGARSFFAPPNVGFPFGQQDHEYYLLQVHYDNPDMQPKLVVDMRLDFFYTSSLRPYDGGVMGTGSDIFGLPPAIMLPPQTTNQRTFSHCPGECTKRMLPPSGIKIFAVHLHSHRSGRRLRLRHFSEHVELPWILNDDNYDSNFQQTRHLKEEIRLLPGDQMTMECIYDNTWTNGTVISGFSAKQEMCYSFLYYYSRINDYSICESKIVSEEYRQRFLGVSNITWNQAKLDWVVVSPSKVAGLTISKISDDHVTWDQEKRLQLMRFHEAHPHISSCSRTLSYRDPVEIKQLLDSGVLETTGSPMTRVNTRNDYVGPSQYQFKARPYVPEQSCSYKSN